MNVSLLALLGLCLPASEDAQPAPQHARDPWVFRSVLDERARMLTAVLADDLWVAYDATTCSLYGAWAEGVHFEGAVYDTVHGPQPSVRGPFLLAPESPPGGAAFPGWRALKLADGEGVELTARYLGYRLDHAQWPGLELHWQFQLAGGETIDVRERPAATADGLRRQFEVSGLPEGVALEFFSGLCANPRGEMWGGTRCQIASPDWDAERTVPEPKRIDAWLAMGLAAGSRWTPWYVRLGEGHGDFSLSLSPLEPAPEKSMEETR